MSDLDSKVEKHVQRLQSAPLQQIESEVAEKRVAWLREHCPEGLGHEVPSPRRAFEMLFFEYMGLDRGDLPIVSESETELVWLSANRCPTLEACNRLGLDTRVVCRSAYEKSTQAFVSWLDPQLMFLRSYEHVRPHAHACRERIVRIDFEWLMEIAIEEAKMSKAEGNRGYGAVVALGEKVLARAHDTASTANDPSQHAEVKAIRQASATLGESNLSGAVLLSTCEPCPMCSSLAVWANVTTIVHGVSIEETAQMGKTRILVSAREIIERSPVMVELVPDILREECRALYL